MTYYIGQSHIFYKKGCDNPMNRLFGLIAFWIAIGMLLMLLIESKIVGIIIVGVLLLIGYNCYCCKR